MGKHIRTLTVYYDTAISQEEIHLFRGAVLKALDGKADILYHNHRDETTFRYAYPLIQYKRLRGKAAIVCVDKGVELIGQFLSNAPESIILGHREICPTITRIIPSRVFVQTWEGTFDYHIARWLPLNTKNYILFKSIESETERTAFLENILKANLLSMLKGLDIFLEKEIQLHITNLSTPHLLYNKGVGLTSFNADFSCNLSIPNNLGIGKNASIGCGVVQQIRKKKTEEVQVQQQNQ